MFKGQWHWMCMIQQENIKLLKWKLYNFKNKDAKKGLLRKARNICYKPGKSRGKKKSILDDDNDNGVKRESNANSRFDTDGNVGQE